MLTCGAFRGHSGRRGPSKTFLDLSPNLTSSNLQGQNLSPPAAYFQEVGSKQKTISFLRFLPCLPF